MRFETCDPVRAQENIIARDLLVAQHVKREAIDRKLMWLEVDGSQSISEMTKIVEAHFSPYLLSRQGALGHNVYRIYRGKRYCWSFAKDSTDINRIVPIEIDDIMQTQGKISPRQITFQDGSLWVWR